jgi:hypothetical protein
MTGEPDRVSLDEPLRRSRDKQVSLRWPWALDQRLDDLVARAEEAGERTNRRELLSALILATDMTGQELGSVLRRYRTCPVADALLDTEAEVGENVVRLRRHRPGPRRN